MATNIAIIVTNSHDQRGRTATKLINAVFPHARCTLVNLRGYCKDYWLNKPGTKETMYVGPAGRANFVKSWAALRGNYDAVVSYDEGLAHHILPTRDVQGVQSTDVLAGMVVRHENVPVLFIMDPLWTYGRSYGPEVQAGRTLMTMFHLKKLWAALQGFPVLEKPIDVVIPTSISELREIEKLASTAAAMAVDIETSGGHISCTGFALELPDRARNVAVVIPYMINVGDGEFWKDDLTLSLALDVTGRILANDVPKVFHNGGVFDAAWLFRYGWCPQNFVWDTMHMLHSTWPTLPKSLYHGAGMMLGNYRYWKDDGKDVDEQGKVKWQVPRTPDATIRYWKYNGLDCANTLELFLAILRLWEKSPDLRGRYPEWQAGFGYAWRNYVREFALQVGPCLYMSMTGFKADTERQMAIKRKLESESVEAAEKLAVLVGDPDFNPNSPPQVAHLLYDVLDLKPLARKGRTTDKRVTQTFADMHPIYADVIHSIEAVKEPRNNASKYGSMETWNGRLPTSLKAGNTTTARLTSSQHSFRVSTNFQNVPAEMREWLVADHGELLCSADYGQSDSYFVAFESGDKTMIETVTDERDTHSVHVEFFFGHKYEDVVASKKEAWVSHPVTGVRPIIKKVTHGTNYDMRGATMLMNIRKDAAVAMCNALLGSRNGKLFLRYMGMDEGKPASSYVGQAATWQSAQLEKACDFAQRLYYIRYKTLGDWKKLMIGETVRQHGLIPMFGGTTTVMLCAPGLNPRFIPAAKGQGGTAGNINNAMLRLYFLNQNMWDRGFRMVLQVHDELVTAIPKNDLELVAMKKEIMEAPCKIRGRTFVVPVEASLSFSWSKKFVVDFEGLDSMSVSRYHELIDQVEAKLAKGFEKYLPTNSFTEGNVKNA